MKTGKRLALIVGTVVCATAVVLVVTSLKRQPPAQSCILPDGTVVSLERATFGKQHVFTRNFAGLGGLLGKREARINTESDTMVFWVSINSDSTKESPDFRNQVVFDEHGREVVHGLFSPQYSWSATSFFRFEVSDGTIGAFTVDAFPRRGKTVGFRLYGRDSEGPLVEFIVPNPTPGPHPVWTAEPYPVTKRDGEIDFTLTGLVTGLRPDGQAARPGHLSSTRATFRISENGKPTKEWEPARIIISDATGNQVINEIGRSIGSIESDKDEIEFWLSKNLCADESAWKLDVEFSRTAAARFSPEEIWSVKAIPVPQENQLIRLNQSDSRQGAAVRLLGIAGPGNVEWEQYAPSSSMSSEIRARVSLPFDGLQLTLIAVDNRGRVVEGWSSGYTDVIKDNEREYRFRLQIPPGASTLDLQFAVHKSRFAQFLAHPSKP